MAKRWAFFISDGTAITVESLGNSLLAQFSDSVEFDKRTFRYICDQDSLRSACNFIKQKYAESGELPLIFETIVDPEIRAVIAQLPGVMFDVFDHFLAPLEAALGAQSNHSTGANRQQASEDGYHQRIDAVNFALTHDDGLACSNYARAQIILVGVSRSGKTPTSLYLALQFGIACANYPFTEEDELESGKLPRSLLPWRAKLFGLSIDPEHLHSIREQRRPQSHYSSLSNCRAEVRAAEQLMRKHAVPFLDSTSLSVEELASRIVKHLKL